MLGSSWELNQDLTWGYGVRYKRLVYPLVFSCKALLLPIIVSSLLELSFTFLDH
jgi:hypothetical protein